MNNKGKDRTNKYRFNNRKTEKSNKNVNTGKPTVDDIRKLKEHFDKKFGRS